MVEFSSQVKVEALPATKSPQLIVGQLIRCGLSPALIYGEAQNAESRDNFIHKGELGVKELKEIRIV